MRRQLKGGVPVAADFAAPRLEAPGDLHRRHAGVLRLVPGNEPHRLTELPHQAFLRALVAFRQRPLQVHQALGIHAGEGRAAVNQGRQHRQGIALAMHVQHDAWRLLHHLRQAPRAHLHRQTLFKGRQDIAEQFGELIAGEMAPFGEVGAFAGGKAGIGDGPQGVAAARHAVAERLGDGRIRLDKQPEAVVLVLQAGLQADGLGEGFDGIAVQPNVSPRRPRQRGQQLSHHLARQASAAVDAERRLDRQVGRRGPNRDGYPPLEKQAAGPGEA